MGADTVCLATAENLAGFADRRAARCGGRCKHRPWRCRPQDVRQTPRFCAHPNERATPARFDNEAKGPQTIFEQVSPVIDLNKKNGDREREERVEKI